MSLLISLKMFPIDISLMLPIFGLSRIFAKVMLSMWYKTVKIR